MKYVIPEFELEEIQNLATVKIDPDSSIIQEKVAYRRKRVNQLRLRGYTNQQIADKIGCNLSTIEKDLHTIREKVRKWFDNDSITEYCISLNDGIILCDNIIEDLQILYQEDNDIETRLEILSKITDYESKKIELYEKTRAVQFNLRGNK